MKLIKFKTILFFTLFFILTTGMQSQNNCNDLSQFYSVKEKIKKRTFKKQNYDNIFSLKQKLVQQISTDISTMSVSKSENITDGNTGYYSNESSTESYITSIGSINNPNIIYCKNSTNYYVVCQVNKRDFELEYYESIDSRSKVLYETIKLLERDTKNGQITNKISELKKDYFYIKNSLYFIVKSNYIDKSKKDLLEDFVTEILSKFEQLENNNNLNFESKINDLNDLLIKKEFERINGKLISIDFKKLTTEEKKKITDFKKLYINKITSYTAELDLKIKTTLRNKNKTNEIDDLFNEYSKITFFENNQAKLNKYKKIFAINNGYARTNISFAANVGNAFSDITNQQSNVNSNDVKFDFKYLLTSFNIGIKHYFFNPRKRIGLTINYSIFNNNIIQIEKNNTPLEYPIKKFSVAQIGLILGPLELNYGITNVDVEGEEKELKMSNLKFSLLRSDRWSKKYAKVNYMNLYAFGNYLSDFDKINYLQVGLGLNYNFALNRTSRF
jgi:hypothetical protein